MVAEPESSDDEPEAAPTNGLPKWSEEDWPDFQRAVALMPGFPKHSGFTEMVSAFQDGTTEAMLNLETEVNWMVHRAQYVAEHCVLKVAEPA